MLGVGGGGQLIGRVIALLGSLRRQGELAADSCGASDIRLLQIGTMLIVNVADMASKMSVGEQVGRARLKRLRGLALAGVLVLPACGSDSHPGSAERCVGAPSARQIIGRLESSAAASGLVVHEVGESRRLGGCVGALANVERVEAHRFLVAVEVTPIPGRDGDTLRAQLVRNWEGFTEGHGHDSRAERVEQALAGSPGLDGASVTGRCSVAEVTCSYWILVDDLLIEAQLLYLGLLDEYASTAGLGDDLIIDFATLLGEAVGTFESR